MSEPGPRVRRQEGGDSWRGRRCVGRFRGVSTFLARFYFCLMRYYQQKYPVRSDKTCKGSKNRGRRTFRKPHLGRPRKSQKQHPGSCTGRPQLPARAAGPRPSLIPTETGQVRARKRRELWPRFGSPTDRLSYGKGPIRTQILRPRPQTEEPIG